MQKRALISVYDKKYLELFAKELHRLGFEIVSTGGTATFIRRCGIPVTDVSELTGFPEMMDGRLKSMHPCIMGGILGRFDHPGDVQEMETAGIEMFQVVCCNLYPFEETIAKPGCTAEMATEKIDVGGPTMIRAAAKNCKYIYVVTESQQYAAVIRALEQDVFDSDLADQLSLDAIGMTAAYDVAIYKYKASQLGEKWPRRWFAYGENPKILRYGENPHQSGSFYSSTGSFLDDASASDGKGSSFVNVLDASAAHNAVHSFTEPTVCIMKHASPCGIASAPTVEEAYACAYASDTKSALGGVIAANCVVTAAMASAIGKRFVECIVAPGFHLDALAILSENDPKDNRRLLCIPPSSPQYEIRSAFGGFLVQEVDKGDPDGTVWVVQSNRQPTQDEWDAMRFAWKACQPVLSNAIVLAQGTATVGIGGGQPNRVDCVDIAIKRAGEKAKGAVMASDSFFPFDDSVRLAAAAGITAIIYQGGGIHEKEVVIAANELGLALVATGVRHFRH